MGLMDLKIAGSRNGITGLQMDCKYMLLSEEKLNAAIELGFIGLNKILDIMEKKIETITTKPVISERTFEKMNVPTQFVKNVIGYGGCNIKKITNDFDVRIKIEQKNGQIEIIGAEENVRKAKEAINNLLTTPEEDCIYVATIIRELDKDKFLVQPDRARSGIVHSNRRQKIGDIIKITLHSIDEKNDRIVYLLNL
jgi:polyribonucleotide nucleotidyltransferase